MTPEERARYSYYQKKLYNDRDELQAAEARGEEKKAIEIAKAMLLDGDAIEKITRITGLPMAEIETLKD